MAISTATAPGTTTARPRTTVRRDRRRRNWREIRAAYAFIALWAIGFLIFTLGPMIASFVLSFTDYNEISSPRGVGLANYRQMWHDPKVAHALVNTFIYAIIYVPAAMAFSLFLAMILNRVGRASGFFRTVFYLPVMTPQVAAAALFLLLLNGQKGIINTALRFVGITGPNWTTDPHWVKPALAITTLWGVGAPW
jgi:multiple sugar transport system permease protein